MKKHILTFVLTLVILGTSNTNAFSQEKNTVFYESFNEIWIPYGWTITQLGTGNAIWEQALPGYMGNGAFHNYSEQTEDPDSWLISPPITLAEDDDYLLTFFEKNDDVPNYYTYSGVKISAGSGEAGHDDFVEVYESNLAKPDYTETTINLSDYAGSTIYIAFVYRGSYVHQWWIDEVAVKATELITNTLTMLEPIGDGSVIPPPGQYDYSTEAGDEYTVELRAVPSLGHTFVEWSQGNVTNPLHSKTHILMDQDHTVEATFETYPESYQLFWHQHTIGMGGVSCLAGPQTNLEAADNFSNTSIENITKLVIHGYANYYDGGFMPWTPGNNEEFIVRFYDAGPNELPNNWGAPVYEQTLNAKAFFTDSITPLHQMVIKLEIDLPDPVSLQSGWVSFQLVKDEEKWFVISRATAGNGNSKAFRINRNNNTFMFYDHDMQLEVWGTEAEAPSPPGCASLIAPTDGETNVGYPIGQHPQTVLKWSATPGATGYELFIGKSLPGEGIDLGETTHYILENLNYNSTYQWKIIPYNEYGSAENCPVLEFTTMEDPTLIPPFSIFFDPDNPSHIGPINWDDKKYGKLQEVTELTELSGMPWLYQSFAHNPANDKAAKHHLQVSFNPEDAIPVYRWFISPPIDLGEEPHDNALFFDVALTLNNNATATQLTPQDALKVVISDDGGATWSDSHALLSLSGAAGDQVTPGGETFFISLSEYSGLIKIGFYVEREEAINPSVDVFLGNITVYETFLLNLFSNPPNGGTLHGGGGYTAGETTTLLATPNPGYAFLSWTNEESEVVSQDATFDFTMPNANVNLYANFELIDYTLTVEIEPEDSGNVSIEPEADYYNINDEILLTATPNEDYQFSHWLVDGQPGGNDPTLLLTMPANNVNVIASFTSTQPNLFVLTLLADPEDGGTVEGDGEYEQGAQLTVSAIANDGYTFLSWTDEEGVVFSTQASFQLTMPPNNLTLVAHFDTETTINSISDLNITVFPNPSGDYFYIEANQHIEEISITDLSGRTQFRKIISNRAAAIHHALPAGLYILKIKMKHNTYSKKLNVQQ